jgi:hypothetical protein
MAIISTLRGTISNERLAHYAKIYVSHRPLIQRVLTTGFILHVLSNTYRGLSARPASSQVSKKGKGKGKSDGKDGDQAGKPPRVAVRQPITGTSVQMTTRVLGGCYILPKAVNYFEDCDTEYTFERSTSVGYAFQSSDIQNRNITLCCCS